MATIYEYQLTDNNGLTVPFVYPSPDILLAQTFTPEVSHTITFIRLKLARTGNPGTVYIKIYIADLFGEPQTGEEPLSEMSRDGDALNTTPVYVQNFLPEPIEVEAGQTYAIVISCPTSDSANAVSWRGKSFGGHGDGDSAWLYVDDWPFDEDDWYEGPFTWDAISSSTAVMCYQIWGEDVSEPPDKATNPTPANNDTEVDFSGLELSWSDGGGADTFDVYIGETGALTLVSSTQAGTSYTTDLSELASIFSASPVDQKIYWRVDAVNTDGTTEGDEWNFDARPGKTKNPTPLDTAEDVIRGLIKLTWEAG